MLFRRYLFIYNKQTNKQKFKQKIFKQTSLEPRPSQVGLMYMMDMVQPVQFCWRKICEKHNALNLLLIIIMI